VKKRYIIISLLILLAVVLFAYLLADQKPYKDFVEAFGSLATGIGLFLVALSVFAAVDANKKSRQANEFSVITSIHERLSSDKSYRIRGYLHSDFSSHLARAVAKVLGEQYVFGNHVDVKKVLSNLKEDHTKKRELSQELKNQTTSVPGVSALEAVELTLLDFDLLAIPVYRGIEPAQDAAESWKIVLEATAKEILPFVAIQRQLRGSSDPEYKKHYLYLLNELKIDLQGLNVPGVPLKRWSWGR
jgi:hypothetical protein